MEGGLVSATEEGTPQGGPLSPLLSNMLLDDLDKELERRGHRFVRYADDCNIYVQSARGRACVDRDRAVPCEAPPADGQPGQERGGPAEGPQVPGLQLHRRDRAPTADRPAGARTLQSKGRDSPGDVRAQSRADRQGLRRLPAGWHGYFGFCQTPSVLRELDQWLRRRLRAIVWKQWKRGYPICRVATPRRRPRPGGTTAGSPHGPWRLAVSPVLHSPCRSLPRIAWPTLPREVPLSVIHRTAVYGPVRTVVWEGRSCEAPPYPD